MVVPPGTALIGVQADGRVGGGGGLAGWHARSRIVRIGSHVAIAAGCVVTVDGSNAAAGGLSWLDAGELTAGAAAIITRFAVEVRTLAIALTNDDDVRLEPLALELGGARRVAGADGRPLDPIAVTLGTMSVLVYSIAPAPGEAVVVRVRSGGDWAVTAVLGGQLDAAELAASIARRGLVAVGAKLLATEGPGVTLAWREPKKARGGRRNGRR